jgi:hypothetical protein
MTFLSCASLLTLIGVCTMIPNACSRLSLSSGIEVCEIAIEDDRKVMDVLKACAGW